MKLAAFVCILKGFQIKYGKHVALVQQVDRVAQQCQYGRIH